VLLAIDSGVIVNLAHWIVLFIIFKIVKGFLLWRKESQEKTGAEELLLKWRHGYEAGRAVMKNTG
jgi:hypothetical protein